MRDRIDAITDLLLGAAHADAHFHDRERASIRALLGKLLAGTELPASVGERIESFDPDAFDVAARAAEFAGDSDADKRKLLELIAAVHEADEQLDLAEDDYLNRVAAALGAGPGALAGLTLEYEIDELGEGLHELRVAPPPIPGTEVDIDLDE